MSLGFSISEGFKGVFKARLATTLSISSITFTILLIGLFVIFTINLQSWIKFLRDKIEIELFIETGSTEKEIEVLKTKIEQTQGIEGISRNFIFAELYWLTITVPESGNSSK